MGSFRKRRPGRPTCREVSGRSVSLRPLALLSREDRGRGMPLLRRWRRCWPPARQGSKEQADALRTCKRSQTEGADIVRPLRQQDQHRLCSRDRHPYRVLQLPLLWDRGRNVGQGARQSRAGAERMEQTRMTMRCDHCRGKFGLVVHRYWRMRFCCTACAHAYQQRLHGETRAKIRRLNGGRPDGSQPGGPLDARQRLAG